MNSLLPLLAAAAALVLPALSWSATVTTITAGTWDLYRSSSIISRGHVSESACVQAAAARNVTSSYTCRTRTAVNVVVTTTPPPPPPVDTDGDGIPDSSDACPTVAASTATGCPVTPPPPSLVDTDGDGIPDSSDACPTVAANTATGCPVTPPPPPTGNAEILTPLLKFAETWARNWNFEGHSVDSRFTSDYGNWDYTATTYEPWLFDRASVGYYLFEATGDTRWRDKFLSDFTWYRSRIDAQGVFTPKGSGDTKYSYVTPFVQYELVTGDSQYRPIAKRIYDAWLREWPNDFNSSTTFWTEREMAFSLEAAVGWYELTRDAGALTRARALVNHWAQAAGTAGAPQVTYTQHEGGGPGGTTPTNLTHSPWMAALYFQALRRYYVITSDPEAYRQASAWATWCETNCFYDAALAHPENTGLVFPRYLTGELIGDAGYDSGNMDHALDVAGALRFARTSKLARGESTAAVDARLAQMDAAAKASFANWTRSTTYLPKYRMSPPRKFNWWMRGYAELSRPE